MSSQTQVSKLKSRIETTGDLRAFLANVALAVSRGDMKINEAAVAVKACEQINASLYSEIKSAALQLAAGQSSPPLGDMQIDSGKAVG